MLHLIFHDRTLDHCIPEAQAASVVPFVPVPGVPVVSVVSVVPGENVSAEVQTEMEAAA